LADNKLNFKKGDTVLVINGEDKGKNGKIVSIYPKKLEAIIEGVNFLKKHVKPTEKTPQGGIIDQEGTINVTNLKLICNKCSKPTTVKERKLKRAKELECVKNAAK